MEGRGHHNVEAVRRSGTFLGRQVSSQMGEVHVGGSKRPVPAVFLSTASRAGVTLSQETARRWSMSPHKPQSRSSSEQNEEVTESSGTRIQVKKLNGQHQLSAHSPQLSSKSNPLNAFLAQSDVFKASQDVEMTSNDNRQTPEPKPTPNVVMQRQEAVEMVDLDMTRERKDEVASDIRDEETMHTKSKRIRPLKVPNRDVLTLRTPSATTDTLVLNMPSLTKLRSTFSAKELALFTQRHESTDVEAKAQTRYHVASHPYSPSASTSLAAQQRNSTKKSTKTLARRSIHKRTLSSSEPRDESISLPLSKYHQYEASWRQVETSIDHIYEDPSLDLVQLHLLDREYRTSGLKKRKMVERKRVLAAASELREHQSDEQRRHEQLQQRKAHLQKMSETIRIQNQKAVRPRAIKAAAMTDRQVKHGKHLDKALSLPERKPAVPRLSRSGSSARRQASNRKRKLKSVQGGVSASILMNEMNAGFGTEASEDTEKVAPVHDEVVEHRDTKRKSLAAAPRLSKRKEQQVTAATSRSHAVVQAREERRALAREYMQLQKKSRRIWNTKAKAQSRREQEKRQQQLETLEATRLRNLQLSKKRGMHSKVEKMKEPLGPNDSQSFAKATVLDDKSVIHDISFCTFDTSVHESHGNRSDKELELNKPHSDNENDQAIGNVGTSNCALDFEAKVPSLDAPLTGLLVSEQGTCEKGGVDERIRKLLMLREKAAALSTRLSGLRNKTDNTSTVESTNECSKHEGVDERTLESMALGANDSQTITMDNSKNSALVDSGSEEENEHADQDENGDDDSVDDAGSSACDVNKCSDCIREVGAPEDASRVESRLQNEGAEGSRIWEDWRMGNESQTSSNASVAVGAYHDEGIDVRLIGVHNIGGVWLEQQKDEVFDAVSEAKRAASLGVASSMSSSSSEASGRLSTSPSTLNVPRDEQLELFSEAQDDVKENDDEGFEVKFYEQMRDRLKVATRENDAALDAVESSVETRNSEHCCDEQRMNIVHEQRIRASRKTSSSGLMRLIRETDDSLSVIDRAAKKLHDEQCERAEREQEKVLKSRIEAEKKELLRKDMALKAVMASLSDKDFDNAMSHSPDDTINEFATDESELQVAQYKRLEEIMDEVENERCRDKEESSKASFQAEIKPTDQEDTDDIERIKGSKTSARRRSSLPVSSACAFWDNVVSESMGIELDPSNGLERHVEIDDSELVSQRESRLQREEEEMAGHDGNSRRVQSPRTLSKRLMAAVEYQESIFEAHLQLAMIEHHCELDTVQAESITLAKAFNEEMEHNARSHQLALDQTTLEKRFDGDMREVLQQLDTIRHVEEQERAEYESRMENELKLAKLRECSVQTETLYSADAATSRALYINRSTSPVRLVVDAAVQRDPRDQKTEVPYTVAEVVEAASDEDDDGDYEETFENESQVQLSPAKVLDRAESYLSDRLLETKDGIESEDIAQSIDIEDNVTDESAAMSADASIVSDEVLDSQHNHNIESKADASISMEYDDDFETSPLTSRATWDQRHSEGSREDVEDVEDEIDASKSEDRSDDSEEIKEQGFVESGSSMAREEAVDKSAERILCSSQSREDASREVLKLSTKLLDPQTLPAVDGSTDAIIQTETKDRYDSILPSAAMDCQVEFPQTSESLTAAFIRDLERRKQAEQSLLDLRLQTVEQKYQRELKQLTSGSGKAQELDVRKETLTMAYLGERANIESLQAASRARYYQDLHSFRSLALNWPQSGSDGRRLYSEHAGNFAPPEVAVCPVVSKFLGTEDADGERTTSLGHADEYTDEFTSEFEHIQAEQDDAVGGYKDEEIAETTLIASELSDVRSSSIASEDISNASEIDEERASEEQESQSNRVEEEEEEYEDEFALESESASIPNAAIVEDESNKIVEDPSEHGDEEYDEDFASTSESVSDEVTEVAQLAIEGSIDDDDEDHASEVIDDEVVPRTLIEEAPSDDIGESSRHEYSDEPFDSGHFEQTALVESEMFRHEESVSVQVGQSQSEDSSTTKLLTVEVAALLETARDSDEARARTEDSKIARKKAKAEELLQMKDRLLTQQKQAFRRDEEKRQVDGIAKLALGLNVEGELQDAKPQILQQLKSEFDALRQVYPMLKATDGLLENVLLAKEHQESVSAPSVMSKLFGKGSFERPSAVDDAFNEEYEAEVFEEEQSDDEVDSTANEEVKAACYEVDRGQDRESDEEFVEAEDSNVEAASEGSRKEVDVDEDASVAEEYDRDDEIVEEPSTAQDESDEDDNENDYEDDSFDESKGAPDTLSSKDGDEASSIKEEHVSKAMSKDEVTLGNADDEEEDAYLDEDFHDVSNSLVDEAPEKTLPATAQITSMASEETSAKEEDLIEAIGVVAAQLRSGRSADAVGAEQVGSNSTLASALKGNTTLINSLSISQSRNEEEEFLTKSIEERIARLEALKEQIEARKSEVLGVQKQMRAERHKEQLVLQEKLLWEEMESIERLLNADEAALALCRQRNRLEMLHLEARQMEHSARGKPSKSVCEQEMDLLTAFDYIEAAQSGTQQQRSHSNTSLMLERSETSRGLDLLSGYVYVEEVEGIESHKSLDDFSRIDATTSDGSKVTVRMEEPLLHLVSKAQGKVQQEDLASDYCAKDRKDLMVVGADEDARMHEIDESIVISSQSLVLQDKREDDGKFGGNETAIGIQQVFEGGMEWLATEHYHDDQHTSSDLLADYAFVEVAESALNVQFNGLVGFDYVETADAVEVIPADDIEAKNRLYLKESGINDDVSEKVEELSSRYKDDQTIEVLSDVGHLSGTLSAYGTETSRILEERAIDGECGDKVAQSIDDVERTETSMTLCPNDLAASVIASGALDESHQSERSQDEEASVAQVTNLLYTCFIQELEEVTNVIESCALKDIIGTIREVQEQIHENTLQRAANMVLPCQRHTLPAVPLEATRMDARYDIEEEDAVDEDSTSLSSVNMPVVQSRDSLRREKRTKALTEDAVDENKGKEPVKAEKSTAYNQESKSSARHENDQASLNDDFSKVLQSERVADAMFTSVFNQILDSELQIWSWQLANPQTSTSPQRAGKDAHDSSLIVNRIEKSIGVYDHVVTRSIVQELVIMDGKIQLPEINDLKVQATRVLYNIVKELAQQCLSTFQPSNTLHVDSSSLLATIQRRVLTKIDELRKVQTELLTDMILSDLLHDVVITSKLL